MKRLNLREAQRLMDLLVLRMIRSEPGSETALTNRLVALPKGSGRSAVATSLRRLTESGWIRVEGRDDVYYLNPDGERELKAEKARSATRAQEFNRDGLAGSFGRFLSDV